ncbi:tRNA (N6-threonylcarbamoyladenosine(37)-N6)-methyltransferase TrmO [Pasteurella skyensis]|uniref:tRNA (N6-threonylcarbamoyladenosine(37)-N6)-methyltransferase TrmO n=1 Tax=Phocoenobacter skyensis TaxID=97481 RepID=A0AAJ6N846_9PAST|nr:tRNA (N6-threonylcarbamoyladenosine(37)-N6)-methyltransferase TrmO [Pasteurella skyensis]MDP8161809.1 tRNA (N6-threonylcarbamoyladenosine(37)-N6)-methyltransferase TrmO [Pasteurella skyensis]MDP8171965.1 tRNA (N6-threonylcarbamoyladenosine(37)-N6)-methyltransferase TrmO [Pasteurella skyensis]MDP8176200.1 tRNA (N6-threonylcarbamoyladenosine(37)-N6)-methyltransferase TrmO [Pasteurella skyensis]MDP8178220.1 tRNA (N6-threonylcarbamoyladenosine(37)-N6)-methyltransferase TrmO [Pasteurella skyensis
MMELQPITCYPVGIIHTPYGEKFSVPRQPNLVAEGKGILRLLPPYNTEESVRGLSEFSHLWLLFQFHHIPQGKVQTTVRPPRLGGNQRVGVFASRSTHRPNPIGLSKVTLEKIDYKNGDVLLYLGSVDLVDGTPILDIKPYLAYADSEVNAKSGFAQHKPTPKLTVTFTQEAKQAVTSCQKFAKYQIDDPIAFIRDVIAQDPRPAYQQGKLTDRVYGMLLAECNIRWKIDTENPYQAIVVEIKNIQNFKK